MLQLQKTQLELAEVIDEVVFAENAQQKAEEELATFQREATHREESLVRCIDNVAQYVNILEQQVVVPAVGTFVTALADYHNVSKSRSAAVQSIEGVASNKASFDSILARLQPPLASTEAAVRRSTVLQSRVSPDDAYVMAGALLSGSNQLSKLAKSSALLLQQYHAAAAARTAKALSQGLANDEVSFLKQEISHLRQTLALQDSRRTGSDETRALRQELAAERAHNAQRFEMTSERMESLLRTIRELERPKSSDYESPASGARLISQIRSLESELDQKRQLVEELQRNGGPHTDGSQSLSQSIHVVKLLQAEVTDLRSALEEQRQESEETISKLKRRNEKLSQQLSDMTSSSFSQGIDNSAAQNAIQRDYLAKIKAFELTIHALNAELAEIEGKGAMTDKRHAEEVQEIRMELQLERRDRRTEREEYESMINRITTEIEKLMKENVELKQRIRQSVGNF